MLKRLVAREVDYLWSRLARATTRDLKALTPLWSRGSDPRVVRLVEHAAYVFARVKEKLEDDMPEISHSLVAHALSEILRPIPSATVVRMADPERARLDVIRHAEGMALQSRPIEGAPCAFRTCWPLTTAPLAIERTTLRTRERGLQTLTLRLSGYGDASLARLVPDPLRFFVETADPFHALDVVRAVCTSPSPLHVQAMGAGGERLSEFSLAPGAVRCTALGGPFRVFPGPQDRFASSTVLRTFYSFPEVFAFVDMVGLRTALADAAPHAHSVEITIRMGEVVSEVAPVAFVLDCAPAVNIFEAPLEPLRTDGLGRLGPLRVEGLPGAEIFHIERMWLQTSRERESTLAVRLWERDSGPIEDDALYLRVERRVAIDRGPTDLLATLLRPAGAASGAQPVGELRAELLVSDGLRTETLLRGDIRRGGDDGLTANLTRVTRPLPPQLEARLPWQFNAYARMPILQFATAPELACYVQLHDARRERATGGGADPATAGFLSATRRSDHRVERDEVIHGDEVDVVLDEATFGGRGATWLVGEFIARAISERADLLRFTRTRLLTADGHSVADYGRRDGERLPPPFG